MVNIKYTPRGETIPGKFLTLFYFEN
jgi:hypothetical protein